MKIKNINRVQTALVEKVGQKGCPLCGSTKGFQIQSNETQIMGFNRTSDGVALSGEHNYIPCAVIIC